MNVINSNLTVTLRDKSTYRTITPNGRPYVLKKDISVPVAPEDLEHLKAVVKKPAYLDIQGSHSTTTSTKQTQHKKSYVKLDPERLNRTQVVKKNIPGMSPGDSIESMKTERRYKPDLDPYESSVVASLDELDLGSDENDDADSDSDELPDLIERPRKKKKSRE